MLQLPTWRTVTKLVLPSSLPLIFTGLRLSLGVGWMVLIAAEMLAQNPGLGKFVWDEFQNGSSQSLAKIMVAVLAIGLIGFLLDRLMYALQSAFTYLDASLGAETSPMSFLELKAYRSPTGTARNAQACSPTSTSPSRRESSSPSSASRARARRR